MRRWSEERRWERRDESKCTQGFVNGRAHEEKKKAMAPKFERCGPVRRRSRSYRPTTLFSPAAGGRYLPGSQVNSFLEIYVGSNFWKVSFWGPISGPAVWGGG